MKYIVVLLLFCLFNTSGYAQKKENTKPKAYLIANAHLDTQWRWDVQTTINEYVKKTLIRNFYLMKKYPGYIFNFEGGIKYAWMKEYYPEYYDCLKKYIREGRWHVAGGSWDANDVLVPAPESSIRNILLGQQFFRKEFGVECSDIYLPDCFGFGWTLPTIATHCGMIGFSSQKLEWRQHPFYGQETFPFTIGLWKGIDGSQILMTHGYRYTAHWYEKDLSYNNSLQDLVKKSPLNMVYRYYGEGDRGGSPSILSVQAVENGMKGSGPLEIIGAESDRLYKDLWPYENHPELPVYDGELLMDVHGTGCYTSQAAMKLYNRQNEMLAFAAENAAAAADWLGAADYPKDLLTTAWQRFIWHQFHDDLTGTSIPRVYEFSWNDELLSLKQFSDVLRSSVQGVADQMDTRVKGIPVVLANANGFPVENLVELQVEAETEPHGVTVYNEKGKVVPAQMLQYKDGKVHILAEAYVPASGFVVYGVKLNGSSIPKIKEASVNTVENSVYRVTVDGNGDICSLYDKVNKRECVAKGKTIRLALFTENKSHTHPAWEIKKETLDREPVSINGNVNIRLVENGRLRKALCIEKSYGESHFRQYIRLYEGCRENQIDFYNEIDWNTKDALLKAEFPFSFSNANATYDVGIGSVERGNNTEIKYEVYAQQWADLTAADGSYGVSVLNDSKYGWDKPDDNVLRLTLLHTPETSTPRWFYQRTQDLGFHTFTYSLVGHVGELDKKSAVLAADKLNRPFRAFTASAHPGSLGKSFSFAVSDNPNIVIRTLKKAEDSDEYVVRVYEIGGEKEQKGQIAFAADIAVACEANGIEKKKGPVGFTDNKLQFSISPFSVKTFKVSLKPNTRNTVKGEYKEVPLPFDRTCFTWNGFGKDGNFESGYTYAAELVPEKMVYGGVPFTFGNLDYATGLTCKGDTIKVPDGYDRIYFLAASDDGDRDVEFISGNHRKKAYIPYYTGFIGQWGHKGHTEGYLKAGEVAYVGTHRHTIEGDHAYEYTYLFKFAVDIPEGVSTVVLPKDKHVVIFAATAAKEPAAPLKEASEMFRTANCTVE